MEGFRVKVTPVGGFVNAAAGQLVTFNASFGGQTVSTVAVFVRANTMTTLELVPTP